MFEWKSMYGFYHPPVCEKTVPAKNCDAIEYKLKKNDIPVHYVARHELFGIRYYELVMEDNACKSIWENDIAELFDIPKEWVGFVSTTPRVICIREDKFNDKFCGDDGVLDLEDFDLMDVVNGYNVIKKLQKRFKDCDLGNVDIGNYKNQGILLLKNTKWSKEMFAKALNIPDKAIVDVSCEKTEIDHVIILDRL